MTGKEQVSVVGQRQPDGVAAKAQSSLSYDFPLRAKGIKGSLNNLGDISCLVVFELPSNPESLREAEPACTTPCHARNSGGDMI